MDENPFTPVRRTVAHVLAEMYGAVAADRALSPDETHVLAEQLREVFPTIARAERNN